MDPRQIRSRHKVLDAFEKLIVRYEYEEITLSEIAREAGITRQTLRANFNEKSDIVLAYMDTWHDQIRQIFIDIVKDSPSVSHVSMAMFLHSVMSNYRHKKNLRRAVLNGLAGPEAISKHLEFYKSLYVMRQDALDLDYTEDDLTIFTAFTSFGLSGGIDVWERMESSISKEELAEKFARYVHFGLSGGL